MICVLQEVIKHLRWCHFSSITPEDKFPHVFLQVLWAGIMIYTYNTPLYYSPETFNGIRLNILVPVYPLPVIHEIMNVNFLDIIITAPLVRVQCSVSVHGIQYSGRKAFF